MFDVYFYSWGMSEKSNAIHPFVSKRMKGNKCKDTTPELMLRKLLHDKKISGYRICYKKLIGKPDIVFTRWKLAVFIHGCFWHMCPDCNLKVPVKNNGFWRSKLEGNVRRDVEVSAHLKEMGWNVLSIWECEIKKDPDLQVYRVHQLLNELKNNKK